ncbi:MAG: hypothetical protein KC495_00880 [Dehalococcoidia bacterium]|nr:hypothetical protein [Dehalococcoidia bacterium]
MSEYFFVAIAGAVIAFIAILNLHIWVGLEEGYAATPADVLDRSLFLVLVDVLLLVGGFLLGIVIMASRRSSRPT